MYVALTMEISDLKPQTMAINSISDCITEFFRGKSYGEGVEKILIHIICVAPVFESFFKVRKLRYNTKGKLVTYDIKLNYYELSLLFDEADILAFLADQILNSVEHLKRIDSKGFNSAQYIEDLTYVLTS